MLSAQRDYKALIRAEKRKLIATQIDRAKQRGAALDAEMACMANSSAWDGLTDGQKLERSFCPARIEKLSAPETCAFYSASAKFWSQFYERAEEAMGGAM